MQATWKFHVSVRPMDILSTPSPPLPPSPPPNMSYPSQSVMVDVFLPKEMAQDKFQWKGLVKIVMKFAVP